MRKLGALTALSLILASCGGGPERVSPTAPAETTVSGRIQTWQSGTAGTVTLPGAVPLVPLASAPVDAAGNFRLILPEGAVLNAQTRSIPETLEEGLRDLGCTSPGLTLSDAGARGLLLFTLRAEGGGTGARDVVAATVSKGAFSRSIDARVWLYADRATTLGGKVNCRIGGSTVPVTLNVAAVPGWNMLRLSATGSISDTSGRVTRTLDGKGTWVTLAELAQALQ